MMGYVLLSVKTSFGCEELHAVTHGDAVFEFGIILADARECGKRRNGLRFLGNYDTESQRQQDEYFAHILIALILARFRSRFVAQVDNLRAIVKSAFAPN